MAFSAAPRGEEICLQLHTSHSRHSLALSCRRAPSFSSTCLQLLKGVSLQMLRRCNEWRVDCMACSHRADRAVALMLSLPYQPINDSIEEGHRLRSFPVDAVSTGEAYCVECSQQQALEQQRTFGQMPSANA